MNTTSLVAASNLSLLASSAGAGLPDLSLITANKSSQPISLANQSASANFSSAAAKIVNAIHLNELQYGAKGLLTLKKHANDTEIEPIMITKSAEGYYVFNNITLKVSSRGQMSHLVNLINT